MADGQAFYSDSRPERASDHCGDGTAGDRGQFRSQGAEQQVPPGNPFAEALAPAMKILVNTGYTDVLAPDKLNQCATACGTVNAQTWAQLGYMDYDRTFRCLLGAGKRRERGNCHTIQLSEAADPRRADREEAGRRCGAGRRREGTTGKAVLGHHRAEHRRFVSRRGQVYDRGRSPGPNVDEPDAVGRQRQYPTPSLRSSSASAVKSTAGKPARSSFDNRNGGGRAAASAAKVRGTR